MYIYIYIYVKRQMQDKEKAYRDTNLGIVMEVHKKLTAVQRWLGKTTPEDGSNCCNIYSIEMLRNSMG